MKSAATLCSALDFLAVTSLAGLLQTARAAQAGGKTKIKLATLVPSGSVWDRTLRTMGADWLESTDGRVELRVYPGGVAGDDPDLVRKMRIGQLQAATMTVSGLTEIDPAFAVFEIPMFFESYDELTHVLEALEPELEKRLAAKGFVLLHWGHGGWIHFFTKRPVKTLEELQSLGMFVWAGEDRMTGLWLEHGFKPVPLAATDILIGLQTGLFEAMSSTPIAALSLQWFRSAPNMIDIPLAPLLGATLMTRDAWDRIEERDRSAVREAARRAGDIFRTQIPKEEALAISEMTRRGLTVTRILGSDDEPAWRQMGASFADGMRREFVPDEIFERALELLATERRRFQQ